MRNFILGIIVAVVVAFAIALIIAQFGLIPTNADATPVRSLAIGRSARRCRHICRASGW